jgi:hypothetical protein
MLFRQLKFIIIIIINPEVVTYQYGICNVITRLLICDFALYRKERRLMYT